MHRIYKLMILLLFFSNGLMAPICLAQSSKAIPGDQQIAEYLPMIFDKRIGLVVNHTSVLGKTHLADTLLTLKVPIKKIFAPEHGFRGTADAGAHIDNGKDEKTGLPIISLYGSHKKPTKADLDGIDVLIFDIQDVGTRFYTYSSTLHYVMEACAENSIKLIILDRPNPNGHYVDGPVLEKEFASFVGLNPIPVVHGCSLGELAKMMNGEAWLDRGIQCDLTVIPVKKYKHSDKVHISVAPSPNLPNDQAIGLYPSLCLFEGTNVSIGRGTHTQFQVVGTNVEGLGDYTFTPMPFLGAMDPPLKGKLCFGFDLTKVDTRDLGFSLKYLFYFFEKTGKKESFFTSPAFFDKLAGTNELRKMMLEGKSEKEIRASWQEGLKEYKKIREKYLIYR